MPCCNRLSSQDVEKSFINRDPAQDKNIYVRLGKLSIRVFQKNGHAKIYFRIEVFENRYLDNNITYAQFLM